MKYELNQIIHADCMDIMKDIPDKYFELAIVDPPYGIGDFEQGKGKNKKVKKWEITWNNYIPDEKYFNELKRISVNQIIWGANYYNCFSISGGAIVWHKNVTHPDMSKCEIASVSHFKKVEFCSFEWNGFLRCENEKSCHPCQKPVSLYTWILKNYAKPNDKIIDTHSGSGSLACACHLEGFDFLAIEKDEDYFKSSVERLETLRSQGRLF